MKTRALGPNLNVSALGLGCMGMSAAYGPPADKAEMILLIRAAYDRGVTLHRLEENLGGVELELTADDLDEINAEAAKIHMQGERLPEAMLKMTGR